MHLSKPPPVSVIGRYAVIRGPAGVMVISDTGGPTGSGRPLPPFTARPNRRA